MAEPTSSDHADIAIKEEPEVEISSHGRQQSDYADNEIKEEPDDECLRHDGQVSYSASDSSYSASDSSDGDEFDELHSSVTVETADTLDAISQATATPKSKVYRVTRGTKPLPPMPRMDILLIVLQVPASYGGYKDVFIDDAPPHLQKDLMKRFPKIFYPSQIKRYEGVARNPANHIHRGVCLHEYMCCPAGRAPKLGFGGVLGSSADDRCIIKGLPCCYPIEKEGVYMFRIVRMPKMVRDTDNWEEPGYFVPASTG